MRDRLDPMVFERPSTRPDESRAWTAKYGCSPWTSIRVSKPWRRASAAGASVLGLEPASTRQAGTSVAPFQLAAIVLIPSAERDSATAGFVSGAACQGNS